MPHTHPRICWTTSVYIVYKNKILLVLHKKLKSWLPVGGHIELEEDRAEALKHEAREQGGWDITLLSPPLPNVPEATDIKFLPITNTLFFFFLYLLFATKKKKFFFFFFFF